MAVLISFFVDKDVLLAEIEAKKQEKATPKPKPQAAQPKPQKQKQKQPKNPNQDKTGPPGNPPTEPPPQ